ncbi:MAG: hypothetical protein AB1801_12290 [Chloroflexota bacterium]
MARGRVEGETPDIHQAGGLQIHHGNHRLVEGSVSLRLNPDKPGSNGIQDKQLPAQRINGQALRVLQAKAPSIVANPRPWI